MMDAVRDSQQAVLTQADVDALCEIAAAAIKKSVADWCRAQIVPRYQGGGIAIESANSAYERVIGMLESK